MSELRPQLLQFVKQPNVAILATLRKDGSPHQTAIWYLYEDGEILISITDGRLKYKHILRDPRVSIAVASQSVPYREVVFNGRAQIEYEGGAEFFRRIAIHYYGEKDGNMYADYDEKAAKDRRLILHFEPEHIISYDFAVEDDYHESWGENYHTTF